MTYTRLLVPALFLALAPFAEGQGIAQSLAGRSEPAASGPAPAPPRIVQRPAAKGNFRQAHRTQITQIVIHKAEGQNASGWFTKREAKGSAHYDVHKDGTIYQSVQDEDIAPHAGNAETHRRSIGIEHAGFTARNDTTEAQYRASAQLVAYLCAKYSIPIDRQHIIGHAEVPHPRHPNRRGGRNGHTDPGPHWDWDRYMGLVRSYAVGARAGARVDLATRTVNQLPSEPMTNSARGGHATKSALVTPPRRPLLAVGARGDAVAKLQTLLRERGFDPGPLDGVFGAKTLAAVRAFQASKGLARDGVVGTHTWAALDSR